MSSRSVEREMLELVAYYDPIDYHQLKTKVGERVGEYGTTRHREALSNLLELDLIERPGMAHCYVHITDEGWRLLGGTTPRHDCDIDVGEVAECPVCVADERVVAEY